MNIRFYISLIFRRLPVMLVFIIVCAAAGAFTAISLPPTYATQARLLVEDAQIRTNSLADASSAAEQLQVIEQRLMTRANMIEIANKFEVFEDARDLTPDEIVDKMKAQTAIWRSAGRNSATLMSVRFEARSGQIAANVLNEYLTIIQEDSRSQKEEQANRTLAFFEQEVDRLSRELDQQSVRIVEFRNENPNALPENAEALRQRRNILNDRIIRLNLDAQALKEQRENIVTVFESTGTVATTASTNQRLSPEETQLARLKLELEGLRAVYSDTYPKVVSLVNQIERLETVVAASPVASDSEDAPQDPRSALLEANLAEVDDRLASIESERLQAEDELQTIGQLLAAIAGNSITLEALNREHDNIKQRHDAAQDKLDTARLDIRVLRSNQSQRITVIEGASVPQVPTGPNRMRIAAMGIAAGFGLAAAYFALLEFLNRTIRRPDEIQTRFNIVPIAAIPYIESKRDRLKRRALLILAVLSVLICVPAALWYIDTNVMPLELIVTKVLEKIGL